MRKQRQTELERIQELREGASDPKDIKRYQEMIDTHFMGTKRKKQKKKKVIPDGDWGYNE